MTLTQFFGYFGILLGVHHPKTNVFVLQDLSCELGVHTHKHIRLHLTQKSYSSLDFSSRIKSVHHLKSMDFKRNYI